MNLQLISCKIELKRGEKILDNKFSIEYTSKMEKALRQIAKDEKNKRVVFLDGQRKKVQAFKDDYFKVLDKALDIYLDEVKGDKNEWFK